MTDQSANQQSNKPCNCGMGCNPMHPPCKNNKPAPQKQSDTASADIRAAVLAKEVEYFGYKYMLSDRQKAELDQLLQAAKKEWVSEVEKKIDGLEVDSEATTKHLESLGSSDDELEQQLLSMKIDADDRHSVLEDVKAVLATVGGEK